MTGAQRLARQRRVRNKRKRIFKSTDGYCYYCNNKIYINTFTIDHVKPKIAGGNNTYENLVPSCRKCNFTKKGMSVYDFLITHGVMMLEGDLM